MVTTTAAYRAGPLDLPPLDQTVLTDASMNNNNIDITSIQESDSDHGRGISSAWQQHVTRETLLTSCPRFKSNMLNIFAKLLNF